ncbi:N-acetylmuramoyl-L-alanine amidase family protein [Saccharibacillus qingshengii]|uniref:N-acetylmuramoyl-L-alanine amidase family protein n=1 Tax=Saccharibacillus qingshengii TaxID=1763540 RepID=UPI001555A9A3|nr:N-acetylmuramoyl-L-alanine amidase family protein [Saccharibacillus qingshengii]
MKFGKQVWKKTAAAFLAVVLLFVLTLPGTYPSAAAAGAGTRILLDGRTIDRAEPVVVGGTTMVPIRVVSQQLGYSVNWNRSAGRITIGSSASPLVLTLGSLTANAGTASVTMQQAPFVQADTTYVPLRFVGSQMGLGVKWEQNSKTVYLQTQFENPANTPANPPALPQPETPLPPAGPAPQIGTSVDGISFSDNRLTISAAALLNPKASALTGPDRIVVDLPGSYIGAGLLQSGPLKLGQVATLPVETSPAVKQVRYSLYSENPSTVRVVIDLNRAVGYNMYPQGNLVIVDLNDEGTAPPVGTDGKKILVIDPGHGAQDPGGIGNGLKEKDMVLSVSLKVAALLRQEPDIDLIMTRSDDTYPTREGRAKLANDAGADVFLSIHTNAAAASAVGTETFYADAARSKSLSDTIQKHVQAATGFRDRGSKQANFIVIRQTTMPAALLEIGFLTNAQEAAAIAQDDFQQKVAQAIVDGLKEYLGLD